MSCHGVGVPYISQRRESIKDYSEDLSLGRYSVNSGGRWRTMVNMKVSMVECWVVQYTQGTEVSVDIVDESKVCCWRDK